MMLDPGYSKLHSILDDLKLQDQTALGPSSAAKMPHHSSHFGPLTTVSVSFQYVEWQGQGYTTKPGSQHDKANVSFHSAHVTVTVT